MKIMRLFFFKQQYMVKMMNTEIPIHFQLGFGKKTIATAFLVRIMHKEMKKEEFQAQPDLQ